MSLNESIVKTVLAQAELLCADWDESGSEKTVTTDDESLRAIEAEQKRYHGPK